jgi:hypothetical protein
MNMAIIKVMTKNDDIVARAIMMLILTMMMLTMSLMRRELVSNSNLFQFEGLSVSHLVLDILPVSRGRPNIEYITCQIATMFL